MFVTVRGGGKRGGMEGGGERGWERERGEGEGRQRDGGRRKVKGGRKEGRKVRDPCKLVCVLFLRDHMFQLKGILMNEGKTIHQRWREGGGGERKNSCVNVS